MPYWRLSGFYFFYFALLGALVPYWGLLLRERGFDAASIGELMAILMATKVVAPNVWGWLGDRLGHRMRIVRAASLISVAVFAAMYWAHGFWAIALVMTLYSFFWNASLPQFEVITFTYLKDRVARYARIRVWGSVGFIVTVILLGALVERHGAEIVLPVVLTIFIGIWLSSLLVRDPDPEPHPQVQQSLLNVLRRPAIIGFFVAVFLMQASHGPYYAFYSIYMKEHGYSETLIGQFWALGVLAEVGLFVVMHRLLERFGGRRVLIASLAFAALRWLVIGYFADSLLMLGVAQLLHAATFGTFHAASIHLVHHYFRGRLQGRGQALYSSLSFGAGGAVGSLASGYVWEGLGAQWTFVVAAATAAAGAAVAWRFIDRAHDF
ncbi:MAG: MFS transporter [Gammaproteobacteria bacterium]|nr:MFS transporter [Gammaproteobacteria bacterium]MCB1923395.1 MFS transporter [Gammaproteobacteria bacterium]